MKNQYPDDMRKIKCFIVTLMTVLSACSNIQNTVDLSGEWEVSLDSLSTFHPIQLPGTTDLAGLGIPHRLKPEMEKPQLLHLTRKHSFIGAAWYRRTFTVPESMANRPLTLSLERVLWQSRVWIDGVQHPDAEESLSTPHEYFMAEGLEAGEHEILLCVDNRKRYDISVKELAHAYTEDTQVKWNGVLGRMELKVENEVKIVRVSTYPDIAHKTVKVFTALVRTVPGISEAALTLQVEGPAPGQVFAAKRLPVTFDKDTVCVEHEYALGDEISLWNEFSPQLYTLKVSCNAGGSAESRETTFGMREIGNAEGHLTINNNRVFLRGTLECCIFPLTGTPPTDSAGWEKVFSTAKAWGLNHLRFHSYCPPEAAFRVADRMGFYLQVELPNWSLTVGQDEGMNRFLYREYDRIISAYGNHPSFCLMSAGNELQPDFDFLNRFVRYMKQSDNRCLYTTSTFTFEKGHGVQPEPEDEFFVTQWTDKGWVRGQGIFDAEPPCFNKDYREAVQGISVPLISHEIGQYAVYPNLKEIDKYTGVLDPLNFKAVKQDLQRKGLYDKADLFLEASGKLAVQLYKEEIERALKTPGFSGFQLLDLHDFPGQGTALVGLLDAFWDSKGLTDASFFRQFCAPVVPLARFAKATYSGDENFVASVEIANYFDRDMKDERVVWRLSDAEGKSVVEGVLPVRVLKKGEITRLGEISVDLKKVPEASKLTFEVSVENTSWKNNWSVWVYPSVKDLNVGEVILTQDIEEALAALNKGRKVLLSPKVDRLAGLEGKFLPVFWSPVHFPKQAGTMGLLCNPHHAALRYFPTDMHSDWQWWNLVKNSKVVVADSLPAVEPIIESVDNFANNRKLVSVFETNCGNGRLIVSAMDLLSGHDDKPEVRQLLYSLVSYMNSDKFIPQSTLDEADLRSFILTANGQNARTNATSIYEE